MQISTNRKALADALAWVATALPKNVQVPSTAGILLSADVNGLHMSAFDYDRRHSATVEADVIDGGDVLVSGRFLATVVAGLKGDTVTLATEDRTLTITSGRSEYRTQLMLIEEYPNLPAFPEPVGTIADHRLSWLLSVAAPISTDDAANAGQVGIRLESNERGLWVCVCSEDRAVIHVAVAEWNASGDLAVTVPTTVIAAAKGLSGPIEIAAVEGLIGLRDASRTVTLRTYDVPYLLGKWRETVGRLSATAGERYTFAAPEFAAAAKQVGALAEGTVRKVVAEFAPTDVHLSIAGSTGGGDEYVPASGEGDVTVYLNADKVARSFPVLGDEVRATVPTKGPITLRPLDRDDALVLMLPMSGLR